MNKISFNRIPDCPQSAQNLLSGIERNRSKRSATVWSDGALLLSLIEKSVILKRAMNDNTVDFL
jgi:hypothetical protein